MSKKSYPVTSYFSELYWIDDNTLGAQLSSKVEPQAFLQFICHRVVEAAVQDFLVVPDEDCQLLQLLVIERHLKWKKPI